MGEIDDLHDAKDERKANAYEGIDPSQQKPVNDQLYKCGHHFSPQ